jgi:4-amino-4-deoxy-L-arabinose transferase-like glycosyltransferase
MVASKDPFFPVWLLLLLGRHAIGLCVFLIALWLNLRWMTTNDVDGRMRCSWGALFAFVAAVLADVWTSAFYPAMTSHHVTEFAMLESACFALALVLSIVGKGVGRVLIGITSVALGSIYIADAFK